jgi:hypothetical protein
MNTEPVSEPVSEPASKTTNTNTHTNQIQKSYIRKNKNIINRKKDNRPTFYYKNNRSWEVRAGGILFYRKNGESKYDFLIMYNSWRNKYEDLGGCTSEVDICMEDTVCREVEEESNGKFNRKDLLARLKNAKNIYILSSKYIIYFLEASNQEASFVEQDFGTSEICDKLTRNINWLAAELVLDDDFHTKLNPRLANAAVLTYLRELCSSDILHKLNNLQI